MTSEVKGRIFEYGGGPFVSVLLPTRGRPGPLCESIDSLASLAQRPDLLEFILKVDDDDVDTIRQVKAIQKAKILDLKVLTGPRGNGYLDIHHWLNRMSGKAKGNWLLFWNDDAKVITHEWDKILYLSNASTLWHGVDDVCLLVARSVGRPHANEFVFLRRKVRDILGHVFLNPHGDNWLHNVFTMISSVHKLEIDVEHYSHQIDDQTRRDSVEAHKVAGPDLNSSAMIRAKIKDATTLMDYIDMKRHERRGFDAKAP